MTERIVVTGVGAVSPIGHTARESWENALAGVPGVGPITLFDASNHQVQIACEVKDFQPEVALSPREVRRRDRFEQFAAVAGEEAIHQAGLVVGEEDAERVGVIIASAIGGINSLADAVITDREQGGRRVSPFAIPMLMSNGAAGLLSIDKGYQGPSFSVVSACASGIDAIGTALMMIRSGMIDVAITGWSEASITSVGISAFDRVGAMSRREPGEMTPRPFDRTRDGLVMGEGAAILVLEREDRARERGAEIMAEIAGYGATADSHHITAPIEDGSGGARAIRAALRNAGADAEDVQYINAHGTGTDLNDVSETRAIKSALGEMAYNIPVSSTKSMTGHMMGATGALETVFCVFAVREDRLPPTINFHEPDPECDLDYIPNEAREQEVNLAVNNAFGFGGHNAVLVVRKYR